MNLRLHQKNSKSAAASFTPLPVGILQRKCACGGSSGMTGNCSECEKNRLLGKPLQRKLAISEPGDQYEQEADRVAEQVMRMPASEMKDKRLDSTLPHVQRRAAGRETGVVEAPPIVHDVLNSSGQPLDTATRAFFESRFDHDFSRVRIHTDEQAAQSARSVQAAAYTVGQHVVFGLSQYAPHDPKGRHLLAHELAHTIQQRHTRPLNHFDSVNGAFANHHVSMSAMVQPTASPMLQRTQCNFYIHDSTEPTKLGWLWERSAVALALGASGGYAIASGDSIEEMLLRILTVYAEEDCDCTEEIQFLSHGSSGNAMYISKTGDEFTVKDFQIPDLEKYGDGPRTAPGYQAWYNGLTLRQRRLVVLRRTICGSDAEVYFRSCEAFQGKKGQEFAKAAADFWRSKVIGHTKVIGLTQPGEKVLKPGKDPDWSETEGVGGTTPKKPGKPATVKPKKD